MMIRMSVMLIVLVLGTIVSVKAQTQTLNPSIPNHIRIDDYTKDSNDTAFVEARLYDIENRFRDGYIASGKTDQHLRFKDTMGEEKPKSIRLTKLNSVVIGNDSLVVLRDIKVESDVRNRLMPVSVALAKVVEKGEVVLYKVYHRGESLRGNVIGSGTVMSVSGMPRYSYFVRRGTYVPLLVPSDIDEFVTGMSRILYTKPEMVKKVRSKEYSYLKIEQLVADFNAF